MLSGARKYGLGLVLAHQEMRQIRSRSEDVASSLLANAYTRVVFQLGEQDARTLADGFSYFEATDFQRLGVGQAIARIERNDFDFNLETSAPAQVPEVLAHRRAEAVRTFSRSFYARPRREVEEMLVPVPAPEESPDEHTPPAPRDAERSTPVNKRVADTGLPGRGGVQHKHLQALVKKLAEDRGFEAEVEKSVLDSHGHIDVALTFADVRVACEISVTTHVAHEVGNLTKCLAAGFSYAMLLSTDERILALARDEIQASGDDRVRLLTVDQFPAFLDDVGGAPLPRSPKSPKSDQAASQPIAQKGFEGRRMLTAKDAASYLGIAVHTLAKWRLSGDSPAYHKFGRHVLYDRSDLDAWIAARKRRSTSDSPES